MAMDHEPLLLPSILVLGAVTQETATIWRSGKELDIRDYNISEQLYGWMGNHIMLCVYSYILWSMLNIKSLPSRNLVHNYEKKYPPCVSWVNPKSTLPMAIFTSKLLVITRGSTLNIRSKWRLVRSIELWPGIPFISNGLAPFIVYVYSIPYNSFQQVISTYNYIYRM